MASKAGVLNRSRGGRWAFAALAMVALAAPLRPAPAQAQFFWEHPRLSADDAARVAIDHGFRVLARPTFNGDVYVADVMDRRGGQQRLIITADSGLIVRRFAVQGAPRYRIEADPGVPIGPLPPGRIPDRDDAGQGFFARMFGDDAINDDDPRSRRDDSMISPDAPLRPPARVRRLPRVVDQGTDVPRDTPIESAPLAPPPAARPPRPRPPAQASLPQTGTTTPRPATAAPAAAAVTPPPTDRPARSISKNPLAIPGSRDQDEKAAATAPPVPASAGVVPKAVEPNAPAGAPKPKEPVAVAPLD